MSRPLTSASNLHRRFLCPGSARLEHGLPEDDSEQSREGQLLHDYGAHPEYDRSVLPPNQRDLLDRNDSLIQTVLERVSGHLTDKEPSIRREVTLSTGTADMIAIFLDDHALLINDTKFGFKIVERADLNLQLRAYAVGAFDLFGIDEKMNLTNRAFVSITQPRLAYEERITLAEYMPEDIEASRQQIAEILAASEKPDAPLVPGDVQCLYCKAKLICPAFQKWLAIPVATFPTLQTGLSKTAREAYLEKRLGELSDDQLEKTLVAVAFGNMIRPLATDEARKRIANGKLDNYHLGKPVEKRELVDSQRAIALLTLGKVATRDEILAMSSLPLGALEEAYRKRTGCTWKEAREKIDKILQSVIELKEEKARVIHK